MQRLFSSLRIAVPVVGLVFVALVVFGVYTALNSATTQYASTAEAQTVGTSAKGLFSRASWELDDIGGNFESADEVEGLEFAVKATDVSSSSGGEVAALTASDSRPASSSTPGSTPSSDGSQNSSTSEQQYRAVEHPAEYKTVKHDAVYKTVTDFYTTCNDCDFKIQGSIYPHQDSTGHGRYSTNVPFISQVLVSAAWEEQVLVKAAWTEWVPV